MSRRAPASADLLPFYVGACYGRGAGFERCKNDPDCPAAQLCSQRRGVHPDDLPG